MPKINEGTIQEITRTLTNGKTKTILQARYQYFDGNGKRKSKTKDVATKTDGKVWLKDIAREHETKKKTFGGKSKNFLTFTNDIEPALMDRKSIKPVQTQLKFLREFFGHLKLNEIELENLEAYSNMRRKEKIKFKNSERQRSDATIAKELSLMQAIFKIAISKGLLTVSPFAFKAKPLAKAKSDERVATLSDEQEKAMLEACMLKDKFGICRANLAPVIITAIESSMRRGEILKLRWKDVDLDREVIRVRKETVKIDEAKTIPMTLRLKETLENHRPENVSANNFVFADAGDFKKAYATVCKYAGVENFTFHDIRHVAITRMIARGMPIAVVMKISGHKEMKTFLRYLNLSEEILVEMMRKGEKAMIPTV